MPIETAGEPDRAPTIEQAAIEQTMDSLIQALVDMDIDMLCRLAQTCGNQESESQPISVTREVHARLSWKLLLLGRLLMQTRINLRLLGLGFVDEQSRRIPANPYSMFTRS